MTAKRARNQKVSTGIYRTPSGWRIYVRVRGTLWSERIKDRFHEKHVTEDLKPERRRFQSEIEAKHPRVCVPPPASGTFAEDGERYLQTRASMVTITTRRRHIQLWVDEFGPRARRSIQPWEIRTVLERWRAHGPKRVCLKLIASDRAVSRATVLHGLRAYNPAITTKGSGIWVDVPLPLSASAVTKRQRALENLWTVLDGLHAPNPVREVPEFEEPEAEARALSYDIVEAILEQMPDYQHVRKLTDADVATIRRSNASSSGLARIYGVSEAMVRKIRCGLVRAGDKPSATKLRLRAIAYTGLSHGELATITPADLHLDDALPWVSIKGRRKGKGTKTVEQPLLPQGAAALRALAEADALGFFHGSSMWKSFQRACTKLGLKGIRPYDLRHSFASEIFEKTGNLAATQLLMRHHDQGTTLRYGKRAIDPVRAAALATVQAKGGFSASEVATEVATQRKQPTE